MTFASLSKGYDRLAVNSEMFDAEGEYSVLASVIQSEQEKTTNT